MHLKPILKEMKKEACAGPQDSRPQKAIKALLEQFERLYVSSTNRFVGITHAGCEDSASACRRHRGSLPRMWKSRWTTLSLARPRISAQEQSDSSSFNDKG